MNILLGDVQPRSQGLASYGWVTFCLFLFYILFPNTLVMNIVFPGKRGIHLENGIRPPISILQIGQVLSAGFLNGLE